jgi:hypothetical protein
MRFLAGCMGQYCGEPIDRMPSKMSGWSSEVRKERRPHHSFHSVERSDAIRLLELHSPTNRYLEELSLLGLLLLWRILRSGPCAVASFVIIDAKVLESIDTQLKIPQPCCLVFLILHSPCYIRRLPIRSLWLSPSELLLVFNQAAVS